LRWSHTGGNQQRVPVSELSNCNSYHHERRLARADDPLGPPLAECTAAVDGCSSLLLARLDASLRDPEIQAALTQHTVFGRDPRPTDGNILEVTVGALGDSLFVGDECVDTKSGCILIPSAIASFASQLQELDVIQVSNEPCATAFPDGSGN
jgi:hypothetical protein